MNNYFSSAITPRIRERILERSFEDLLLDMDVLMGMTTESAEYRPSLLEMETLFELGWTWDAPIGVSDLLEALEEHTIHHLMDDHGITITNEDLTPYEEAWLISHGYGERYNNRFSAFIDDFDVVFEVVHHDPHTASILLRLMLEGDGHYDTLCSIWYF